MTASSQPFRQIFIPISASKPDLGNVGMRPDLGNCDEIGRAAAETLRRAELIRDTEIHEPKHPERMTAMFVFRIVLIGFLVMMGAADDLMTVLEATRSGRGICSSIRTSEAQPPRERSAAEAIQVQVMAVLLSSGQEHRVGANQNRLRVDDDDSILSLFLLYHSRSRVKSQYLFPSSYFLAVARPAFFSHTMSLSPTNLIVAELIARKPAVESRP